MEIDINVIKICPVAELQSDFEETFDCDNLLMYMNTGPSVLNELFDKMLEGQIKLAETFVII